MISHRAFGRCRILIALVCILFLASPVSAYEFPLSSESIRQAYFLGQRRDEATVHFMQRYVHHLPVPKSGPYIAEVRVQTPFAEVVERSQETLTYTAQDAVEEFLGKPGIIRISTKIYFTPSYTAILRSEGKGIVLRSEDFWRHFKVRFIQGRDIPAETIRGEPLFSSSGKGMREFIGAELHAEYSIQKVYSTTAEIEIIAPTGNTVETIFDLSKTR